LSQLSKAKDNDSFLKGQHVKGWKIQKKSRICCKYQC